MHEAMVPGRGEAAGGGVARRQQVATALRVAWTTYAAAVVIAGSNLIVGKPGVSLAVAGVAAAALLAVWWCRRGWVRRAGWLLSFMILATCHFSLHVGSGLRDAGVVTYPLIVLAAGLLLGRSSVIPITLAGIGSLSVIGALEHAGYVHQTPHGPVNVAGAVTLLALMIAAGWLVWTMTHNAEQNLADVAASERRVREAYDRTLEGWARLLEIRDFETEGHTRRVTEMSVRLGQELGCSSQDIEHLRRGALLHDIGKIAIPDHILLKPGPLSGEERLVMEQHTTYAVQCLYHIAFLRPALCVPHAHHERWDGRGYPRGLAGEEIPLLARVFAVIDTWDALRSDRPYRGAWSEQATRRYLREHAGVQFDPRVVGVFLEMDSDDPRRRAHDTPRSVEPDMPTPDTGRTAQPRQPDTPQC